MDNQTADPITLTLDGRSVTVPAGTTLLKAAQQLGEHIPTICYHDHCTANALCRICVVEVEGARVLAPACVAQVSDGMVVRTRTERVERSRRTILEMLDSTVDLSEAPEIQQFIGDYRAERGRFPEAGRREHPLLDDNPMYVRDYSKCILCWRCVQVCADDAQFTFAINFEGRGFETGIGTFFDKPMPETTCVFCGQCVGVCPTGALKPKREWLLQEGKTPDEIMEMTRAERRKKRKKK
ncbi:MAG: putative formate dehydrogenase iron-sulfur protein [Anaerolineales bacterium]|jgi:NADH dehydrogenase/NADH:ubiquinone oxidoreductase subunit G|nr:putative formate dehydrogenase iron-sulfur protein [Anaerolineales bacterium]